jgi:hypothetical protein
MQFPIPKCPRGVFSSGLPMKGSSQECHNLTSYWTKENAIRHDTQMEDTNGQASGLESSHPYFMKVFNAKLIASYMHFSKKEGLEIPEMWIESTGFFPLGKTTKESEKNLIHLFYRAVLSSKASTASLSHLHHLAKNEVSKQLGHTIPVRISSQLLVR